MHAANGEVRLTKLLRKPVDLPTGVAEHNGLGDGQAARGEADQIDRPCQVAHTSEVDLRVVQIEQGLSLEVLL